MRYLIAVVLLISVNIPFVTAQNKISGIVTDQNKTPLAGVTIHINAFQTSTDDDGMYTVSNISGQKCLIRVEATGYNEFVKQITIPLSGKFDIVIEQKTIQMEAVVIVQQSKAQRVRSTSAQPIETADSNFLRENLGGSLMQSLERIGGINTISIGSGQSKPVIRGLGFNRVVVAESGIKHEGQQWGSDHGLEMDQYAVGNVKIIKGPASLAYGSDAIGGVIEIEKPKAPAINTFGGSVDLTAKSNNKLYGSSINLFGRKERFYFDARFTAIDYSDYKVPVDFINIYSYKAPLHQNKLRNTAGNERNLHATIGWITENFNSAIYFSNLNTTNGLFANAHGLEPRNVDTVLHDASDRDIQNPSQQVNHLKVISRTKFKFQHGELEIDLGFQNNLREEYGEYINHGFMPPNYPSDLQIDKNLERGFNKTVFSGTIRGKFEIKNHKFNVGVNAENQQNDIGGWGFIIPQFQQTTTGIYGYDQVTLSQKWLLHLGIRYDYGGIRTGSYSDWFASPLGDFESFLQRAEKIEREFSSINWAVGLNFNPDKNWLFRANIGKSFRMPIAKELASNGVNYHQFSYELGDANLKAEESYQLDLGMTWNLNRFSVDLSPFLNYFTNYIYLNPTSAYDYSYGAGNQIYQYTGTEVLRYGSEIKASYAITKELSTEIIAEYVYSEQRSGTKKGYTLPFSPAPSVLFNISYEKNFKGLLEKLRAGIDYKLTARQNEIVPPEENTPGYQNINLTIGTTVTFMKQVMEINFQAQNLLNATNFNHTSFYRLIGVPEPGRNFIVSVNLPFKIQ